MIIRNLHGLALNFVPNNKNHFFFYTDLFIHITLMIFIRIIIIVLPIFGHYNFILIRLAQYQQIFKSKL